MSSNPIKRFSDLLIGLHTNGSITVIASSGVGTSSAVDLTVDASRPGLSKSFSPSSIFIGGRSTLTFAIDNTANASNAIDLGFMDQLPPGMIVASPSNASRDCALPPTAPGTLTAEPGSDLIEFTNGGIAA